MRILDLSHRVTITALISLLLIASSSAWAASNTRGILNTPLYLGHLYVGSASGSLAWEDGDAFSTLGINSGYQWPMADLGFLAFELSFNSSVADSNITQAPNGSQLEGNADFQSVGIDWLYRTKGTFYGLAKFGFYQNDTNFEIPQLAGQEALTATRMERKYNVGLGAGWKITPSIPLNLEFIYSTITAEADLASLRLLWHFQRKTPKLTPYLISEKERARDQTISSSLDQSQQRLDQPINSHSAPTEEQRAKILSTTTTNSPPAPTANSPTVNPTPTATTKFSRQNFGKSLYNAERTVKSMGCRTPQVSLLRTSWPIETYQAICSSGDFLIVSCEWGSCRVME